MLSLSQPLRILTVTGIFTAFTTEDTMSYILSGFLKSEEPASDLMATLGTGHPILISITAG